MRLGHYLMDSFRIRHPAKSQTHKAASDDHLTRFSFLHLTVPSPMAVKGSKLPSPVDKAFLTVGLACGWNRQDAHSPQHAHWFSLVRRAPSLKQPLHLPTCKSAGDLKSSVPPEIIYKIRKWWDIPTPWTKHQHPTALVHCVKER